MFDGRGARAREQTMYAIIKTGGKQYKAAKDDVLILEKLEGDAGQTVELAEPVLPRATIFQ